MTIINGLLLLTMTLLAGSVYLVLDGLHQAEMEAHLALVRLARHNQIAVKTGDRFQYRDYLVSAKTEEQIQACQIEATVRSQSSINDQGFFTINIPQTATVEQTTTAVEFWQIEKAA